MNLLLKFCLGYPNSFKRVQGHRFLSFTPVRWKMVVVQCCFLSRDFPRQFLWLLCIFCFAGFLAFLFPLCGYRPVYTTSALSSEHRLAIVHTHHPFLLLLCISGLLLTPLSASLRQTPQLLWHLSYPSSPS